MTVTAILAEHTRFTSVGGRTWYLFRIYSHVFVVLIVEDIVVPEAAVYAVLAPVRCQIEQSTRRRVVLTEWDVRIDSLVFINSFRHSIVTISICNKLVVHVKCWRGRIRLKRCMRLEDSVRVLRPSLQDGTVAYGTVRGAQHDALSLGTRRRRQGACWRRRLR